MKINFEKKPEQPTVEFGDLDAGTVFAPASPSPLENRVFYMKVLSGRPELLANAVRLGSFQSMVISDGLQVVVYDATLEIREGETVRKAKRGRPDRCSYDDDGSYI